MGSPPEDRYVVGLGNPGWRYRNTRHNVGFMVLKELRRRWDFGRGRSKFHGRTWTGTIRRRQVRLLAPQTYVNRSGLAAAALVAFYKAETSSLLVVLDDMALPTGRLRARAGGSAGGHNGLADILAALGTEAVPRLRMGISPPPAGMDAAAYVLSGFNGPERQTMARAIPRTADAVEEWVEKGIASVMNRYNADGSDAGEGERDGRDS